MFRVFQVVQKIAETGRNGRSGVNRSPNRPSLMIQFVAERRLISLFWISQLMDGIQINLHNRCDRSTFVFAVIQFQKERPPITSSSCCISYEDPSSSNHRAFDV